MTQGEVPAFLTISMYRVLAVSFCSWEEEEEDWSFWYICWRSWVFITDRMVFRDFSLEGISFSANCSD